METIASASQLPQTALQLGLQAKRARAVFTAEPPQAKAVRAHLRPANSSQPVIGLAYVYDVDIQYLYCVEV